MRAVAAIGFGLSLLGGIAAAGAAECPGNPYALGVSRVLTIDPSQYPRLGTVQYSDTLPLEDKEVVLTFDDGPLPPYTNRVLEVLAAECVKANYFLVGRMARGYPELVRRIQAEGHVIGTHSQNHPLAFDRMPLPAVRAEIEDGINSVAAALGNRAAVTPFFRIPGLLRADGVEQYLQSRRYNAWSADITADDWKHISANEVVRRTVSRLEEKGRGIILLHDIQPATALALPQLLKELKARGYRIVLVQPAGGATPPLVASATPQPAAAPAPTPAPAPLVRPAPYIERGPFPAFTSPPPVAAPAPRPQTPMIAAAPAVTPVIAPPLVLPAREIDPPVPRTPVAVEPLSPAAQVAQASADPDATVQPAAPVAAMPGPAETAVLSPQATTETTRPLAPRLKPSQSFIVSGKVPVPTTVPPAMWPRASIEGAPAAAERPRAQASVVPWPFEAYTLAQADRR